MNAVELLKADHDTVEELFAKFKENEDGRHGALLKKIKGELDTHTHIEETIFYPKLLKGGNKELKTIVREGIEEHRQVKMFLGELAGMRASNKKFNPKLKVVVENVEHHVKEEEKEMFPMVEHQFSTRVLENLGAAMQREKTAYQQKHRIKPSKQTVKKGTIETMLDTVKSAVGQIVAGKAEPTSKGMKRRSTRTQERAAAGRSKQVRNKPTKAKPKAKAAGARG